MEICIGKPPFFGVIIIMSACDHYYHDIIGNMCGGHTAWEIEPVIIVTQMEGSFVCRAMVRGVLSVQGGLVPESWS